MINASSTTNIVLGFSLSGSTIPAGCGTLVELDLIGDATGLSGIIVSDPSGSQLDFEYYEWGIDTLTGCTDPDACNYDETANADDGSCESLDECGECGGSGIANGACDCAGNVVDCAGECGGSAVVDVCGVCQGDNSTCPIITDIDGNIYSTIQIGTQNWMQQNLKSTHYLNGDDVPFYDYENNASYSETYGRLYTWDAVDDERHVCLDGWHVPSDDEWKTLEVYLGMSQEESNNYGWRGNNEGDKLKEDGYEHWESGGSATNESGFTALPSGHYDNGYYDMGTGAYFWTRSGSGSEDTFIRHLSYDDSDIYRPDEDVSNRGMAIRCIETIEGCTDSYADNNNPDANWDDGSCAGYPDNGDYSLSFDGENNVDISMNFNIGNPYYSITGRFNTSDLSKLDQCIINTDPHNGLGISFNYHLATGRMLYLIANDDGSSWDSWLEGIKTDFVEDQWYSFAIVRDGTYMTYYIDGIYDGSSNIGIQQDFLTNIRIGSIAYVPAFPHLIEGFMGLLDNISIWNTNLTQNEIQLNINQELNGQEDNLLADWRFNTGSGTTLYDHSGNGNHGSINGATWNTDVFCEACGCTNPDACNYDSEATEDDGSCQYLDACGVCGGTGYADNCGVCDDDPENDCPNDCFGVPGGDAAEDCAGECGGTFVVDQCGICGGDGAIFGDAGCCEIDVDQCGICGGYGSIPEGVCDCEGNLYNCNICIALDPDGYGIECSDYLGYAYDGESCSAFTGCGPGSDAELFFDTFAECEEINGSCQNCKVLDPLGYGWECDDDFGWAWTGDDCENIFGCDDPGDDVPWFYESYGVCMTRCNYEGWSPWEDDPAAYQFTAVMNVQVLIDGVPFAEAGDHLAAFDIDGNVRGVGTEQSGIGPYDGQIIHEIIMRSNAEDDLITFQFYDTSENRYYDICESYTFVENDIIGFLTDPHILNCATFECWDGSQACSEDVCPDIPNYPYDWEDNPNAYEFTATMNALVLMDGNPIAEEGDILAAFDAAGTVRGVGTQVIPAGGPYDGQIIHEILMRSNASGDALSFKYYDASEDEVLSSGASYTFVINDLAGTLFVPYELNVGTVSLSIELAGGWNMFSVNAIVDDMNPNVVLASLSPAVNDQIKNLGGSSVYYGYSDDGLEYYGWQGSLGAIDVTSMYMISLSSDDLLDFTGTPVDPSTAPISLASGWNWIGYLPQGELDVNTALTTVAGTVNDQIKNQGGSSVYYGYSDDGLEYYGWQGSLVSMAPGEGFMLKVAVGSDLVYPNADGMARMSLSLEEAKVLPLTISSWDVNPHDYEFSGTIDMSIDSRADFNGDWVGVFVGSECRGIAERMYFPIDGSYYYSVMVFSNVKEGEKLSFKYYSSLDDEIIEYAETEEFIVNMNDHNGLNIFGLSRETGKFGQPTSYGLSKAYPNPFNPITTLKFALPIETEVSISVYNLQGREIISLVNGNMEAGYHSVVWNADNNSSGMYFVKMIAGEYVDTQKLMLVK